MNLRMLVAGRIDATVGDVLRFTYLAAKENLSSKVASAGCLPSLLPGYLLLPVQHKLSESIMELVDSRIEAFQQAGKLEAIYASYDTRHFDARKPID